MLKRNNNPEKTKECPLNVFERLLMQEINWAKWKNLENIIFQALENSFDELFYSLSMENSKERANFIIDLIEIKITEINKNTVESQRFISECRWFIYERLYTKQSLIKPQWLQCHGTMALSAEDTKKKYQIYSWCQLPIL